MDLLDFARGPALQVAIYIFIAGSLWRILGVLLLQRKPDHSEARQSGGLRGALGQFVADRAIQRDGRHPHEARVAAEQF